MAAAVAIGLAYSILQTVTAVVRLKKHNQGNILLDFYGDKVHIKRAPTHKHTNNCFIYVSRNYILLYLIKNVTISLFCFLFRMSNNQSSYLGQVVSTIIATGAVAGFAMTGELQRDIGKDWSEYYNKYFRMSHAADGLAFLGFVCAFISSVVSSYALPKRI